MPALRVMVVRFDDAIITEMTMDAFMMDLTRKLLEELPEKRFGQDKRDADIASALNKAWLSLRRDLFSVGHKLNTWI
jgi:hypothetical protein